MDYALDHFTMHNTQLFVVQGSQSLFTYQNIGTNTATIQGSNDASTWSDIASLASGASLVKEHSYKYLRCLGDTQVSVNRGEGDNTIGGGSSGGAASYPSFTGNADKVLTVNATEDDVEWTTVSSGVALGETSSTAYRGDNGKIAYDHSQSQGNPHNTTTSDINEGTKLFFTEPRVKQTVLTGLDTSTASPALATDQILAAIGKLQAQINNMINTPSYPDFTSNAGKVLVVNATEDGVEWITLPSGVGEPPSNEMHFTTLAGLVDYVGTQGDQILLSDNSIVDITTTGETVTFNAPSGRHVVTLVESVGRNNYVSVGGEALAELHNFPALSTVTKFNFSTENYNPLPNLTKVPNFLPSNITNMGNMFGSALAFNQPLNNWNVSNVTNMGNMFYDASSFNQPLNNWNVSNVTYMEEMFSDASSFNQDLSLWCVSQIPSTPDNFDLNATNWTLPRPVWGTCPAP